MSDFNIDQFKGRVRLFSELIIAAMVCLSLWSLYAERTRVIAGAQRSVAAAARDLSTHSANVLAESDRILQEVAHDLGTGGGRPSLGPRELFYELRRQIGESPGIGSVFLVDRSGTMYANSTDFSMRRVSVADREYFRYYLDHPDAELTLSRPVLSRLVNRWRFNLIRPLNRPGERFDGLVAVALEVSYFKSILGSLNLGNSARIALIRNDGALLVREPMAGEGQELDLGRSPQFWDKLSVNPSGTFRMEKTALDDVARIVSYHRVKGFPVVGVVSLSEHAVLVPWEKRAALQLFLTVALSLLLAYLTRLFLAHLDLVQGTLSLAMAGKEESEVKAALLDAAGDGIFQIDDGGRLIHFNEALRRMTGYSAAELSRLKLSDLVDRTWRRPPSLKELLETGPVCYETHLVGKNGVHLPVEVQAQAVEIGMQRFVLSVVRDIAHRKRSDRREGTRLKILESMATGGSLVELLDSIVRFAEEERPGALCSILLFDEKKGSLRHGAAPSLPQQYNEAVDGLRVGNGVGTCGTAAFLRRRVVVEDIEGHPHWQGFPKVVEAGLRSCWSEPILAPDGKLLGTFAIYHRVPKSPGPEDYYLLESAAHLASLAIARSHGEDNRKRLEEQLLHIQKIEAIGQLAAGVAHDFNNLLTPILVYAGLLKKELPGDEAQLKKVSGILSAAQKAQELAQKLLSFGRKQLLKKAVLDLNEVVSSFQEIMSRTVRENISVKARTGPESVLVLADRGQIEQILLNLLVNARDAIEGNGAVTVKTERRLLDESFAKSRPGLKPGMYSLLSVTDNGCGIDPKILQHVFEPFFTTKSESLATGMGLATVYGIVKQHEGYIEIRSGKGEGTTVDIYFPAAPGGMAPAAATSVRTRRSPKRMGTVLVVEDNEMVREMAVELLVSAGYVVLSGESPAAALEIVKEHEGGIDLVVTDVVMPQMNGPQFYATLSESRPGLPVLYMSGYAEDLATRELAAGARGDLLRKPFTSEEFLLRVERSIGGGRR